MGANPYKKDFPILSRKVRTHDLIYLDNAATTQKPTAVIQALTEFYERHNANVHRGVHTLSEEATALYEEARGKVARFLNAPGAEAIVFTSGTTDAINLVARGWAAHTLAPGDEILLTVMEHHSNVVPWQMVAQATGARIRYLDITDAGRLRTEDLPALITERTRLVALAHTSNVLGSVNPVREVVDYAHRFGARVLVDAAQGVSRGPLDVQELGCDFLAFSGHKLFGPTGVGVLYGTPALLDAMEPAKGGGGMIVTVGEQSSEWTRPPWKFEAGTPNVANAVALGAAIDYLNQRGMGALAAQEHTLAGYLLERLREVPGLTLYGPGGAEPRAGVISFNLEGIHPHDVSELLDERGVAVRGGHHCCQLLMKRLGIQATVRASLALYNDYEDVDGLIEGLAHAKQVFAHG